MKVQSIKLKNFMLYEDFSMEFSPHINVICGSNSTGKTALIKLIYSLLKAWRDTDTEKETKDRVNDAFFKKLTGVFRPDDALIGHLARKSESSSQCSCNLYLDDDTVIEVGFNSRAKSRLETLSYPPQKDGIDPQKTVIFLPPKEMISATENFRALYEEYHIAFDETYYDLAKLLDRPLKRGISLKKEAELTARQAQNHILDKLGELMQGSIIQRENRFYLRMSDKEEYEMGLVSEGYRKLATLAYLIQNGSLNPHSVLFWDEPETNMNPKMIFPLVEAVLQLARLGVQVFVTTHDYFLQQYFNLAAVYPEANPDELKIKFISLYHMDDKKTVLQYEEADRVSDLEHNAIMEEFDAIYNREQGIIYDQIGKRNQV